MFAYSRVGATCASFATNAFKRNTSSAVEKRMRRRLETQFTSGTVQVEAAVILPGVVADISVTWLRAVGMSQSNVVGAGPMPVPVIPGSGMTAHVSETVGSASCASVITSEHGVVVRFTLGTSAVGIQSVA